MSFLALEQFRIVGDMRAFKIDAGGYYYLGNLTNKDYFYICFAAKESVNDFY